MSCAGVWSQYRSASSISAKYETAFRIWCSRLSQRQAPYEHAHDLSYPCGRGCSLRVLRCPIVALEGNFVLVGPCLHVLCRALHFLIARLCRVPRVGTGAGFGCRVCRVLTGAGYRVPCAYGPRYLRTFSGQQNISPVREERSDERASAARRRGRSPRCGSASVCPSSFSGKAFRLLRFL